MSIEVVKEKHGLTPEKHALATAVVNAFGGIILDGQSSPQERASIIPKNLTLREIWRRSGIAPRIAERVIEKPQCLSDKDHDYLYWRTRFEDTKGRIWEMTTSSGPRNRGIKQAKRTAGRKESQHAGGSSDIRILNIMAQKRKLDNRVILRELNPQTLNPICPK